MNLQSQKNLLNIGCGHTFHRDWVNLDVVPADPTILRWDVKTGLPFADGSFDVVYCSHVLEHLVPEDAIGLVKQMLRVLRPQGIVRVVVPDLEVIAREYLRLLGEVAKGDSDRHYDYEWIVLELYDQAVRNTTGGRMGAFLARHDLPNRAYILSRAGAEAQSFWDKQVRGGLFDRLAAKGPANLFRLALNRLQPRARIAAILVRAVAGRAGLQAFQEGMFRRSGEIHQWMYDHYSLGSLMRDAGFTGISRIGAGESAIPGFANYRLDVDGTGSTRKPDSLYMEARRS